MGFMQVLPEPPVTNSERHSNNKKRHHQRGFRDLHGHKRRFIIPTHFQPYQRGPELQHNCGYYGFVGSGINNTNRGSNSKPDDIGAGSPEQMAEWG
ncbi:hypothetical protein PG994_013387 [Apiospora phragmitis]|uniref:Uncharacterized protein n=1 Tax=Apiospora phragmitis TaxID=2905665 RepID=A0ABR1TAQ8_9PEZI